MTPFASPFTDQLAAWSTAGGVVVGVASVLIIGLGLLRELRRRRDDLAQADRERLNQEVRQARLITAVLKPDGPTNAAGMSFGGKARPWRFDVEVANDSDGAILDVTLVVLTNATADGTSSTIVAGPAHLAKLGGHKMNVIGVLLTEDGNRIRNDGGPESPIVRIEFTDTVGQRWRRTGTNQPERLI